MSDTPRTDAFSGKSFHDGSHELTELYNFTMDLERELNAAKAENAALLECLGRLLDFEPRQKDEDERDAYVISRLVFDKITNAKKGHSNA